MKKKFHFAIFTVMRYYIKQLLIFLKAAAISLLFGASWAVTFYGIDTYASTNLSNYRSDFFIEIIVFFFSGLVGALLFFILMRFLEFLLSFFIPKA